MKLFKKKSGSRVGGGSKKSGRKPFKKRGFGDRGDRGGGRDAGDTGHQMYETTCNECGNRAEVPFRPTGSKPILCRDCFRKDDRAPRGRFDRAGRGGSGRPKFADKRPFDRGPKRDDMVGKRLSEINKKLDVIMEEILELKEGNF